MTIWSFEMHGAKSRFVGYKYSSLMPCVARWASSHFSGFHFLGIFNTALDKIDELFVPEQLFFCSLGLGSSILRREISQSCRFVYDDQSFDEENKIRRKVCYVKFEGRSGKTSIVPRAIIDWCSCTILVRDSINGIPAAGEVNLTKAYMYCCTVLGCSKWSGKLLRFPILYANESTRQWS